MRLVDSLEVFDGDTAASLLTVAAPEGSVLYHTELLWSSDGSRLIEAGSGTIRIWDARPTYNHEARTLARRLLGLGRGLFGNLPLMPGQSRLAEEVIENIRHDVSLDREIQRATIAEAQKIGDRDLMSLCGDSREVVVRSDRSQREYQRAVRMSEVVARFAPWSAYCIGVLGMAEYRTNDNAGALNAFARTAPLRPEPLPAELVFKAMALHRLGRSAEAAAVTEGLRAESTDAELKALISELEGVLRTPVASPRKTP